MYYCNCTRKCIRPSKLLPTFYISVPKKVIFVCLDQVGWNWNQWHRELLLKRLLDRGYRL